MGQPKYCGENPKIVYLVKICNNFEHTKIGKLFNFADMRRFML